MGKRYFFSEKSTLFAELITYQFFNLLDFTKSVGNLQEICSQNTPVSKIFKIFVTPRPQNLYRSDSFQELHLGLLSKLSTILSSSITSIKMILCLARYWYQNYPSRHISEKFHTQHYIHPPPKHILCYVRSPELHPVQGLAEYSTFGTQFFDSSNCVSFPNFS